MTIIYSLLFGTYIVMAILIYLKSGIKYRSNKFKISLFVLLFIIALFRIYKFQSLLGVDTDEAMGAINAWSLGKYGIDYFNLGKFPVYLYAWGSGMNILYPALCVPFIKWMGLSIVVYRVPLILINIVAICFFAYALISTHYSGRDILLALMIIFLSPATINNSRWAVESNLFPTIFYFVLACFILYVNSGGNARKTYYVLTNLFIAISAYVYSNYWIFLAIFVPSFLIWLFKRKWINIKQLLLTIAMYVVIELPLLLFVFVNFVYHKSMYFLGMYIPKLDATRSVIIGPNVRDIWNNAKTIFYLFLSGSDSNPKMGIMFMGPFLPFMLTFAIIGLFFLVRGRKVIDTFMLIMLISLLPNIFFVQPTWVHYGAILLPILYFEYKGVRQVFTDQKTLTMFCTLFICLLIVYAHSYTNDYNQTFQSEQNNSPMELRSLIRRADLMSKPVYIVANRGDNSTNIGAMYTLPILYTQINPYTFYRETRHVRPAEYRMINDYGKWHIRDRPIIKKGQLKRGAIYIVSNRLTSSGNNKGISVIQKGTYYTMFVRK